jgi:hypothetical protein
LWDAKASSAESTLFPIFFFFFLLFPLSFTDHGSFINSYQILYSSMGSFKVGPLAESSKPRESHFAVHTAKWGQNNVTTTTTMTTSATAAVKAMPQGSSYLRTTGAKERTSRLGGNLSKIPSTSSVSKPHPLASSTITTTTTVVTHAMEHHSNTAAPASIGAEMELDAPDHELNGNEDSFDAHHDGEKENSARIAPAPHHPAGVHRAAAGGQRTFLKPTQAYLRHMEESQHQRQEREARALAESKLRMGPMHHHPAKKPSTLPPAAVVAAAAAAATAAAQPRDRDRSLKVAEIPSGNLSATLRTMHEPRDGLGIPLAVRRKQFRSGPAFRPQDPKVFEISSACEFHVAFIFSPRCLN